MSSRGNEPMPTYGLDRDFPLLWEDATTSDFAERLGGCADPRPAEIDKAMRELWDARRQAGRGAALVRLENAMAPPGSLRAALRPSRPIGLLEAISNLQKGGYSLEFALAYERLSVMAALEALERLVADLETNSEAGAPDYAHKALVVRGV